MPSPGATVQLWLQPPLLREHWSAGTGRARHLLVPCLLQGHPLSPGPAPLSPQSSPSSEPSPQSSEPSQSFSGGRQMEVLLAQVCEGGLHTRDSQFSSSELSSQSLSPSQTQALLMHRAVGGMLFQVLSQAKGAWGCLSSSGLPQNWKDRSERAWERHRGALEAQRVSLRTGVPCPQPTEVHPREGEKGPEDDSTHQDHGSWGWPLVFPHYPGPEDHPAPPGGSPCSHPSPCSRI